MYQPPASPEEFQIKPDPSLERLPSAVQRSTSSQPQPVTSSTIAKGVAGGIAIFLGCVLGVGILGTVVYEVVRAIPQSIPDEANRTLNADVKPAPSPAIHDPDDGKTDAEYAEDFEGQRLDSEIAEDVREDHSPAPCFLLDTDRAMANCAILKAPSARLAFVRAHPHHGLEAWLHSRKVPAPATDPGTADQETADDNLDPKALPSATGVPLACADRPGSETLAQCEARLHLAPQ